MTLNEMADAHTAFVRDLRLNLHEMSQPLTVLLCTLEFGADLTTVAEMRTTMISALTECERLRSIVNLLREQLPDVRDTKTQTPMPR